MTDQQDFDLFMQELGLPKEIVDAMIVNLADQIPMPEGINTLKIAKSDIQGVGMFSVEDVKAGFVFAPARLNDKRTPAGRYINHSTNPNSVFIQAPKGDLYVRAMRDIAKDEEVTISYRQAAQVNGAADAIEDLKKLLRSYTV